MTFESLFERLVVAVETIATGLNALIAALAAAAGVKVETPTPAVGQPAPSPSVQTVGTLPAQAPPSSAQKPPRKQRQAAPEQTQPAVAPASAPTTAPVAATAASSPTAGSSLPSGVTHPIIPTVKVTDPLSKQTGDAIIALANDFSPGNGRDMALAILAQRRGSKKVSELTSDEYQGVFDQTVATYAQLASAKANASLI